MRTPESPPETVDLTYDDGYVAHARLWNRDAPGPPILYLHGIQSAVLDTYRMNDITVRARIAGNTAPTELILNKSRQAVYVTLGDTTNKICDATIRE